jgi:frataxin-like iron-binding protein CyaY
MENIRQLKAELDEYEDEMPVEIEGVGRVVDIEVSDGGVLILKGKQDE